MNEEIICTLNVTHYSNGFSKPVLAVVVPVSINRHLKFSGYSGHKTYLASSPNNSHLFH